MATTQIVLSLVKLFIMIVPGYVLANKNIIDEHQSKGVTSIITCLTWPCLIVASLQREFSVGLCINMGILAAVMVAELAVACLMSVIIGRCFKLEKNVRYLMMFMLMFGSTGFMGIPVCSALYGSEGVFYAALAESVQNVFVFTLGLIMMGRSAGRPAELSVKNFINPGFVSVVAGLGLFFARITLPNVIAVPVETIGATTSPLVMLVVGYQLGRIGLRELFSDIRIYVLSAVKLIVTPLIFLVLVRLLFPGMNVLLRSIIIETAMPVAACTTIFTRQYDGDVEFATKGVMLSTLLSVITLTGFALIVEMI